DRYHRLRVHHVERRHGLRDFLRLHQFRQRHDVPADRADPRHLDLDQPDGRGVGKAHPGAAGGPAMTALHAARGPVLHVVGFLVLWQVLYWIVGDIALRSPMETLRYTAALVSKETFRPHFLESMKAFAVAIVIAISSGVLIGLTLGFGKLAGRVF